MNYGRKEMKTDRKTKGIGNEREYNRRGSIEMFGIGSSGNVKCKEMRMRSK